MCIALVGALTSQLLLSRRHDTELARLESSLHED
jgi:hypothetical protein